jgi:hypothetical protein
MISVAVVWWILVSPTSKTKAGKNDEKGRVSPPHIRCVGLEYKQLPSSSFLPFSSAFILYQFTSALTVHPRCTRSSPPSSKSQSYTLSLSLFTTLPPYPVLQDYSHPYFHIHNLDCALHCDRSHCNCIQQHWK